MRAGTVTKNFLKMLSALCRWIRRNFRLLARLLLAGLFACPGASAAEVDVSKLPPATSRKVDFVKDIQPILVNSCYECHGEKKQEAMLRWDAKEIALNKAAMEKVNGLKDWQILQKIFDRMK